MPEQYDVIIAGLGAMGSAAAFHLSRAGKRVAGFDRFAPPHAQGSSHGQTRIIREAYFEHPSYVPLVQRAYVLWEELSRLSQTPLFLQTGGLMLGSPQSAVFNGAKRSADTHGLPYSLLTAEEVRKRFPALRPEDDMAAIWEPRAGVLFPEQCVSAHLTQARRQGAQLHTEEPVLAWKPDGQGVRVTTNRGEYGATFLILTAGSWLASLLADWKVPLRIERQILFWFGAIENPSFFEPAACPIHLWEFEPGRFFYGFPDLGHGVKVACHHDGEFTSPDQVRRDVSEQEIEKMRRVVRRFLPSADGPLISSTVCLYTNTPDEHFWLDRHPACPQVLIASPCSGHGFKFSSAIGEVLSQLVLEGRSAFDLSLFRTRW
jgi:sarcosine oxidase